MHGHRVGVKDAKPRLSSRPGPQIGKLSEEYLTVRNQQMRTKNLTAEMQLAERRGELIEKKLVEQQAAYLLVALRQAILNVPQTWCRRLLGLNDAAQVSRILREMAISLLGEINDLPAKVTNPDWLEEIEEDTKSKRGK
jgi:phage terminase Nu1 subunit (DNA packaging protein)